jgi:sterol desaturase/sphingolipid hydroxylase (fatty acid hydroxylase superfamily)
MLPVVAALAVFVFAGALFVERVYAARPLPGARAWLTKGTALFLLHALARIGAPYVAATLLRKDATDDDGDGGAVLGGVAGFLASDAAHYAVHRALHRVPLLWRWVHQLHHSAERLDVAGASWLHPFDLVVFSAIGASITTVLRLSPGAAAIAGLFGLVAALFEHMNVRTPAWIGFVIQRPEAHAVHHARGVHAYNYGSFMLWDLVFRTFRNPATFADDEVAGFWDGASERWPAMLAGRDVTHPTRERKRRE